MVIKGKWVWITGASSGIGKALAIEYAKTGCKLLLSARNEEQLNQVKLACVGAEQVEILPLDLLNIEESIKQAKSFLKTIGPIHTLVNNAGISQRSLVNETSLDIDRRIMEINFFAVSALTKLVLPQMIENKEGQFIAMSSLVGKFGSPLRSTYSASKHALHGFYESLRAETSKDGIKTLLVCPGFIKTNISLNAVTASGDKQNKMDSKQDNGMLPDELAKRILKAVKGNKEEVVIGGSERYGVLVKRLFPALFSKIIKKIKVT
jgi:dehydrogenase/reductase SDR family protein 7B